MIAVFYSCCLVKNGKSDYIFACDPTQEKYQRIDSLYATVDSFIVTNGKRVHVNGDANIGVPSINAANFYAAYGS